MLDQKEAARQKTAESRSAAEAEDENFEEEKNRHTTRSADTNEHDANDVLGWPTAASVLAAA